VRTEVLFEGVRTEAGDLALLLGGIEAGVYMLPSFWKKWLRGLRNRQEQTNTWMKKSYLGKRK